MSDDPRDESQANPDFGQQVRALFDACQDLPQESVTTFIEHSDVPDAVRQRVLSLLRHQHSDRLSMTDQVIRAARAELGLAQVKAGDQIEHYRLIRSIGRGGQGEVWLANRQDDEFTHQVAIKFLKPVHNPRELLRFQTERELLASLQHPNIAQLLGGGSDEAGHLYMVLEWIEGETLLDHADRLGLGLEDRLECFRQVCEAVSHAHSKGIIHRDIKPSNILINAEGIVKLIDFGIAKPIDSAATETQSETMLTLAYASPEQLKGDSVTTASDIHALGLVLYELLTGQRAQCAQTDSPGELVQSIITTTPQAPSQVVHASDQTLIPPRRLVGDLDNLILMALRKEPERRYRTVQDLITDLNNFLRARPLIASGDSLSYRTGKLLRRNPIASVLAAVALIFMICLPVVMYRAQQQIAHQRDEAQQQTQLATQTLGFLTSILESASPLGSGGTSIELDDILDQGERQLMTGLDHQPRLKARLLTTLASIRHNLGETPTAIRFYEQAAELFEAQPEPVELTHALGQSAIMHFMNNDRRLAWQRMDEADASLTEAHGPTDLAWHAARKMTLLQLSDRIDEAIELGHATLEMAAQTGISDPSLLGRLYNELAGGYRYVDSEQQLKYLEQALHYAAEADGIMHPTYQGRLLSKAVALIRLERYEQAQQILNEALEAAETLYSKQHPHTLRVVAEQATLWHDRGQFDRAESAYRRVIDGARTIHGDTHTDVILWTNNLAYLLEDMGQLSQAEPLYRESIRLRRESAFSPVSIARTEANLARVLARSGQYREAEQLMQTLLPVLEGDSRRQVYNQLTQAALIIADGSAASNCRTGMDAIDALLPALADQSDTSWRRMRAELWMGELALRCGRRPLGESMLKAAQARSTRIYAEGSIGRELIDAQIDAQLNAEHAGVPEV